MQDNIHRTDARVPLEWSESLYRQQTFTEVYPTISGRIAGRIGGPITLRPLRVKRNGYLHFLTVMPFQPVD